MILHDCTALRQLHHSLVQIKDLLGEPRDAGPIEGLSQLSDAERSETALRMWLRVVWVWPIFLLLVGFSNCTLEGRMRGRCFG